MPPSPSSASSSTSSLVNDGDSYHRYMRTGIGGAGNYRKGAAATPAPAHVMPAAVSKQRTTRTFTSGIGGAGNAHRGAERSQLSFDEEQNRSRAIKKNAQPHVSFGIGGAGNRADTRLADAPRNDGNYSKEPLPYGAVDILRNKLFSRKKSVPSESSSNGSIGDVATTG